MVPLITRVEIPDGLLTCLPNPVPSARPAPGQPRDQHGVGRYIVDLREAGEDCRSKLARIRDMQETIRREAREP